MPRKPQTSDSDRASKARYRARNRDFINSQSRARYHRNLAGKYTHLGIRYGVTRDQYDVLYEAQHGKCAICDIFKERLDVDHCHSTGRIRGLLCGNCNRGLGMYMDNPRTLRRAAEYVEK